MHIASSVYDVIGTPSHQEDIDAILLNKSTILYEKIDNEDFIDITYPITNANGQAIAALGVAVSLNESDVVLQKAMSNMRNNAIQTIFIAIMVSVVLALALSAIISRKILSPLRSLKNAALSISRDKKYEKIAITADDEVGQLASAFNLMSSELKTLHESMEEKIEEKTKELQEQFLTDALTGLPNRQALINDLKEFPKFGLAILDVSGFKDINDVYGTDIGNKLLIELSKKYKNHLIETDLKIYRISGDETAIVNIGLTQREEFINKVKQIVKKIEHETFYFEDENLEINVSIHAGVSCETSLSLEKANMALIKAKKEHLDYLVYDEKEFVDNSQENSLMMISKIKRAVNNYGFKAYYQPIVDEDGKILKFEALVRMEDENEVLSPYFFLDVAKKGKYYQYVTRAMIFQALSEFEESHLMVSINICGDDLLNDDTKEFIINQLKNFKEPERVVLELVESEDLHEIAGLKKFISTIKSFGVKIAIDDFGTGYSNFSYLLDLEPDYIKIDGSLIKNVNVDEKSRIVVDSIVTFAHNLNVKVIAEFVHSIAVLVVCKELKIDEFQGYLFGEPSKSLIKA